MLWSGQAISELGTRISEIAYPLLVLGLTGSPFLAGVVGFVAGIPPLALTLLALACSSIDGIAGG